MNVLEYSNVNGVVRLETALRPDQELDSVTWGMLTHNQIPGVARTSRTQLDDRVALVFEVVGERLSQYMEKPLRRSAVVALLDSLVKTLVEAERYMIPTTSFVLTLEDVFVDPDTGGVTLVCLPLADGARVDPLTFFKQVVFNLRYDERDDSTYVSNLIGVLAGAETLDLARFARVLRTIDLSNAAGMPRPASPYGISPGAPTASDVPPVQAGTATAYGYVPAPGAQAAAGPTVPTASPGAPASTPAPAGGPVGAPRALSAATAPAQGPGFAIPTTSGLPVPTGARGGRAEGASTAPDQPEGEKQISLLYLLQHYSAENKAAYDRQRKAKAARKAAAAAAEPSAPASARAAQPAPSAPALAQPAVDAGQADGESFGHTVNLDAVGEYRAQASQAAQAAPATAGPGDHHPGAAPAVPPAVPESSGYVPQHAQRPEPSVVRPGPPAGTVLHGVLRRPGSSEVVRIDKPVFVLGRRRTRVDLALSGETVSKRHAIIHTDANGFSIIDNASTNGVEIDGQLIPPLKRVRLVPGAKLEIGDEILTFDVEV